MVRIDYQRDGGGGWNSGMARGECIDYYLRSELNSGRRGVYAFW